jgi:hypothetical protein
MVSRIAGGTPSLARGLLVWGIGVCSLAGCEPFGAGPERLTEVEIAPDFMFATQRSVELAFDGSLARSPRLVEVFSPKGERLYRGPLGVGPAPVLPMAAWIESLTVRLLGPEGTEEVVTPIKDGRAEVRLPSGA